MEQSKIDAFMIQNAKNFAPVRVNAIRDALEKLDDSKSAYVLGQEFKDPSTVLILSIILGCWGVDRFMLGEVGLGILKILTCGGVYIWWIIDMINAQDRTKDYNFKKLQEALMMQGITIY